jgi:NADH dehydrogenase [ubiquinone] 1 alpha subcomplex assembly factor 1
MGDPDIGGFSVVNIEHVPKTATEPAHMRFHGKISTELPKNSPHQRMGYAGWRNKDRRATIFGRSVWNIDPYAFIALRVKSDGRKYFVNLQTETIVPTDIHQHRLYSRRPGQWETIFIRWNDFVRTNHGYVVEPQLELLRQKVKSVGISLIDRVPGPFDLSISQIWATNRADMELPDQQAQNIETKEVPPKN